jgi:hypothetical protein
VKESGFLLEGFFGEKVAELYQFNVRPFQFGEGVIPGPGGSGIHQGGFTDMINGNAFMNMTCKTNQGLMQFYKTTDTFAAHMYTGDVFP